MNSTDDHLNYQMKIDMGVDPSRSSLLRIAYCLPELKPLQHEKRGRPVDAAYIQQEYIALGLQARGHRLTFVAPNSQEEIVYSSDLQHLNLAPQTWSASRWFEVARKVTWRIQRWLGVPYLNVFSNYRLLDACLQILPGQDLVYERNALYSSGVAKACERLRLQYVLFFDADQILELDFIGKPITGLLRWRAKRLLRYNLRVANCVICVSEQAKNHLTGTWGVPAKKIVVFPNGVDIHRFRPNPELSSKVRASLGLDGKPLILFVGNFYEWHDVATLLDAFVLLLVKQPEAHLVLVGDGEKRQMMMNRATELGIGNAVRFTGTVPHSEVPGLLAAADVAVAPYLTGKQEFWLSPLKLFEYMASGTAVIASAIGQLPKIIQDGKNGLLVPPGDVTALADALKCLIEDATLRARLGQQARQDSVKNFSWDHYVSRLERLFTAVIAGQPVSQIKGLEE